MAVHAVGLLEAAEVRPHPDVSALIRSSLARTGCPSALIAAPIVDNGPAIGLLLGVAERIDADLIVVGSRGIGRSERPLGSVSAEVVASADVPVLVVAGVGDQPEAPADHSESAGSSTLG